MVQKVLGTSKLYQHGKTQITAEVRRILKLKDGGTVVFFQDESGRIYITGDEIEIATPRLHYV